MGASRRLDPRIRYKWIATAAVSALISAVVVGFVTQLVASETAVLSEDPTVAYGVSEVAVQVGAVALMVFLVVGVGRAVLYYRSWRYEVREDSLYLTRGVLTRRQTVAPYVRVQHIDTQRSPFDRLLGLSSLVVYTAGTRGADVTIPGLTYDRAATLQTRLKRLAIATEEEDAV
ncbi:MAG: PH domain-containing protein [Haloarculaceae archaeon]